MASESAWDVGRGKDNMGFQERGRKVRSESSSTIKARGENHGYNVQKETKIRNDEMTKK